MPGIMIQHKTARSSVHVVPVLAKPVLDPETCPTCNIVHPVHSIHLWLDDAGKVLVSEGVLEDLKTTGMLDIDIVGHVEKPPTLRLYRGVSRAQVDQENRAITMHTRFPSSTVKQG